MAIPNKQDPIVLVIDFHHARYVLPRSRNPVIKDSWPRGNVPSKTYANAICRGPEIEHCIANEGANPATDNDWSLLPFMALSDGAHLYGINFPKPTLTWPRCVSLVDMATLDFIVESNALMSCDLILLLVRPRNSPILPYVAEKHPRPLKLHCSVSPARASLMPSSSSIARRT